MQCTLMKRQILGVLIGGVALLWGASVIHAEAPTLVGIDPDKPMILPITVQAAYNNDTMFFNIEWEGDRGDTHDLLRYTNGAWQKEGGTRRDAQATIDDDPARGPTNQNSTNYESRVTFMVNDPNGPHAVPNFDKVGCFSTCHDNSRAMPEHSTAGPEIGKYLNTDPANPDAQLDLWHHRIARANPIGMSDDQKIIQTDGTTGGRQGDGGEGAPYQTNNIVDGHPTWVLNNDDTGGEFAFPFEDTHTDPNHNFMRDGDTPPNVIPRALDWDAAVAAGYEPQEGDTVPRRRLRDLQGTVRGDISGLGTTFTPDPADPDEHFGHIESNTQRLLDSGDPDDTALVDGGVYDIAFGVHTGMVTVRDHYVTFAKKIALGDGDPDADIVAVKVDGDGRDVLPDWSQIPETAIDMFLPGIASLEFLEGKDEGKQYYDPATDSFVDQTHAGAGAVGGTSCTGCHTAAGGPMSMETLVPQRGGVWSVTPLIVPEPGTLALVSLLAGCGGLGLMLRRRRQR